MNRPAIRMDRAQRGFGLLELMVTLVVGAAVLAGIMSTFFQSSRHAARLTDVADARQNARTAIQLIEREIRM
ncbi:MAG: PilW family protein, partial [bacterium]